MKKGGVSAVEEGPNTGIRLNYCSIRSVHQEEIQLLKKDKKMNSISRMSGVTTFLRSVSAEWILGKD